MPLSQAQTDRLKVQRDRFVAFAFAGAEVLVELDSSQIVTYCAGATEPLFGYAPEQIIGHPFASLVSRRDQVMLAELMSRLTKAGRMDRMMLQLQSDLRPAFPGILSAIIFPERPDCLYVTLSRALGSDLARQNGNQTDEPARTKEEFAKLAERRLAEARQFGNELQMTMIEIDDPLLAERLDPTATENFIQNIESYLRAWSVDGKSVGILDDNKFGLIHDKAFKANQISDRISAIAAIFDPSGQGVEIKAATLSLDREKLTQEDLSKALVYTINRFVEEGGEDFAVKSLSGSYQQALDETLAKVNAFRETIGSDAFTLVFQPIIDLRAWQVHHYEALSRMIQGDRLFLPARFIGFAEEFGVVNEFDLMVVRKSISMLRKSTTIRRTAEIAVNLSGRSISNPAFVQQLLLILVENRDVLPRLMFEVTESAEMKDLEAANRVLQKLRSFGCKISIDDFGAGAAAFQYLKALQVDYVKIDGSYILDAFSTSYGRPFLKAIANLATDLKIQSIGEMVEDARTMWLLRDVGVDYGQGYFFGRPMQDASQFSLSAKPEPQRTRVTS